ncbi:Putative protein in type-1 retrotransposable element R1DM [Araneus ventricosus]|uniref:Reverse transcriptase domain-containing protein n=1 Tax=Araneus ventricosus TaxID=182803 RepID=A0A4Y2RTL3_ARAVE|nr:Putative protein in type-1 retrotransposable element R1DM [Araneus ventricosus]
MKRKRVGAFRRRAQRATTETRRATCQICSRERAQYRRLLARTRRAWSKFCEDAANPFGRHYKAIFRKRRPPSDLFQQSTPADTEVEQAENILRTLYPATTPETSAGPSPAAQNDRPFSSREITRIIKNVNKTKAPGFDGLDNIILQQIHQANPELLLLMFNKCLEFGLFPSTIKIGVVVLFYKEGKSQNDPMSYRRISLLPSIGKLLEKLMSQRLSFHPKTTDQQHPKQYGFKEGASIDHALDSHKDYITRLSPSAKHFYSI